MMIVQGFVFEMRSEMTEFDHRILALLKQQRERPEKFRPEPDLCDASTVLNQLRYQANWE